MAARKLKRYEIMSNPLGAIKRWPALESFSYDDCQPGCDCGGHVGPGTCGCHVTGAEARKWIRSLESEADALAPVVEVAQRFVSAFHGWGRDSDEFTAAINDLCAAVLSYEDHLGR